MINKPPGSGRLPEKRRKDRRWHYDRSTKESAEEIR